MAVVYNSVNITKQSQQPKQKYKVNVTIIGNVTRKKVKIYKTRTGVTHFRTLCLQSSLWLGIKDSALINKYYIVIQREDEEFLV